MFKAESYSGHKLCRPGDIVVNTMWAWMAALGVSKQSGIVSPSYGVYRPRRPDVFVPDFVDHLLRTTPYAAEYVCRSTGIRASRLRLYPDKFLDIPIVRPPYDEQKKAVVFLRQINYLVHRFIRAKRRLIELLNEQKQAIIQQAVTRGLDHNVRLKPSGTDWLGDVPEHWLLRRLKCLVRNVNDQTKSRMLDDVYIALENIESWTGYIKLTDTEVEFESQVKRFQPGDILFGKLRPYLAKVARPGCAGVCVGEFLVLQPTVEDILPEFLEQKLRSAQIIDLINSSTFGAKMPRADWTFIGNIVIAFPPSKNEQRQILSEIRRETAEFENAVCRARREIDLMTEYRTRLITDVVTGKVDVRDLAELLTEDLSEGLESLEEAAESCEDNVVAEELEGAEVEVDADD